MRELRAWRAYPVLLLLPGLLLGAAGLFHPESLSYETAQRWWTLHVPGLLVFPLVGWALAELVAERRDAVAWSVRATAYVYATFYTALDVVSGIGAGYVTRQLGPGVPRPEAVSQMFRIGTPLGEVGSWALIACVVVLLVDRVRALGAPAAVGRRAAAGGLPRARRAHLQPARGAGDGAAGRRVGRARGGRPAAPRPRAGVLTPRAGACDTPHATPVTGG